MKKKIMLMSMAVLLGTTVVGCNADTDEAGQARYEQQTLEGNENRDRGVIPDRDDWDPLPEMDDWGPLGDISSESTSMSSDDFPHTKAQQVQEAKFDYVIDKEIVHDEKLYEFDVEFDVQRGGQQKQEDTDQQQQKEAKRQEQKQQHKEQQQKEQQQQDEQQEQQDQPSGVSEAEQQVVELTNAERREQGLDELQIDEELNQVANKKSTDMQENNYFSHTSPTYGSPFDMIRDHDISYNGAAENIAQGQDSPEQVVQSWMDSQGHRENILNGDFTHIGVGYDENGHHWTQMFISR
ncbi:CAP domain-containing protein [Texcoconibacillus texcoconensis]|uniref:Putative YkwD family protein n=1 Tax=Texcoconibacillus texcoconensis TaxID=1095777 RepID=A0A840QQV5_9BACI|nr:putative YkwD family protein [Texcoconibacillus texcoconensis]